jgi:hypothetical protein
MGETGEEVEKFLFFPVIFLMQDMVVLNQIPDIYIMGILSTFLIHQGVPMMVGILLEAVVVVVKEMGEMAQQVMEVGEVIMVVEEVEEEVIF